jgi:hypothetical protein
MILHRLRYSPISRTMDRHSDSRIVRPQGHIYILAIPTNADAGSAAGDDRVTKPLAMSPPSRLGGRRSAHHDAGAPVDGLALNLGFVALVTTWNDTSNGRYSIRAHVPWEAYAQAMPTCIDIE